ncbi:hypothetical protein E4U54_005193, partial [Claviceps lovelessii]
KAGLSWPHPPSELDAAAVRVGHTVHSANMMTKGLGVALPGSRRHYKEAREVQEE